jgi:hypothetical protein
MRLQHVDRGTAPGGCLAVPARWLSSRQWVPRWCPVYPRHALKRSRIVGGVGRTGALRLRLGHADPSMTLDVYSHLFQDTAKRTRSVVDAAWGTKINQVADSVRTNDGAKVSDLRR